MPATPGPPDAPSKLRRALGAAGVVFSALLAVGVAAFFLTLLGPPHTSRLEPTHSYRIRTKPLVRQAMLTPSRGCAPAGVNRALPRGLPTTRTPRKGATQSRRPRLASRTASNPSVLLVDHCDSGRTAAERQYAARMTCLLIGSRPLIALRSCGSPVPSTIVTAMITRIRPPAIESEPVEK